MTTAVRWWAPAAPGIGPDEFDTALFQPQGDPVKDLGQTLLAVHRVGAAALEAVATEPLHDEVTVRGVLATARELMAPPAVEAISKSFEGAYGPLLLRDVLDDAEAAAVALYRTCITKRCAPSVAARRAGLVYGVPLRELGQYMTQATDPKASDRLVEEMADRTLMGYVAKVLEEEAPQGAKVEVSKAPAKERDETLQRSQLQGLFDQARERERAATQDDPATPYHDARDAKGQFAVEGRPTLRGAVERKGKIIRDRGLVRRGGAVQRAGVVATERATQTTDRVGTTRATTSRAETERAQMTREELRLERVLVNQAAFEIPPSAAGTGGGGDGGKRTPPGTVRQGDGDEPPLPALHMPLRFAMTGDDWTRDSVETYGTSYDTEAGQRIWHTRQHGLMNYGPHDDEDEDAVLKERRRLMGLVHAQDQFKGPGGQPAPFPDTERIPNAAHAIANPQLLDQVVNAFLERLESKYGPLRRGVEKHFVVAALDATDKHTLVLAYQPPTPGRMAMDRKHRTIVEVRQEDTYGYDSSTKYGQDLVLDQDLPLELREQTPLYDSGFIVRRFKATPIDDDLLDAYEQRPRRRAFRKPDDGVGKRLVAFGKATEKERTRSAETANLQALFDQARQRESEYLVSRNVQNDEETGRFERRTGRVQRSGAKARTGLMRGGRAELQRAETTTERVGTERVGTERARSTDRATLERVAAAPERRTEDLVYLDDAFKYVVPSNHDLAYLLEDNGFKYLEQAYKQPFVTQFGTHAWLNRDAVQMGVDEARLALLEQGDVAWTKHPMPRDETGTPEPIWGRVASATIASREDLGALALDLEDFLFKNPRVQVLRVLMTDGDAPGSRRVTVMGNTNPMHGSSAHLIRVEPGVTPHILQPEGAKRLIGASGLEYWLKLRMAGQRQLGRQSDDQMPVPVVFTWSAVE